MKSIESILLNIFYTHKVTSIYGFHLCFLTVEGDIELKIKIFQSLHNDLDGKIFDF